MILRNFISLRWLTVWNFVSVNLTGVKFSPKRVSLCLNSCERYQWSYLTPKWSFTPKWNLKPVWVHFGFHVNVLSDSSVKTRFFRIAIFVHFGHCTAKTFLILEFWNKLFWWNRTRPIFSEFDSTNLIKQNRAKFYCIHYQIYLIQ